MKSEMVAEVKNERRQAKKKIEFLKLHDKEITRVTDKLKDVPGYISMRVDNALCINLAYSGTFIVLKDSFHAFRSLGYQPDARPGVEKSTTFSCNFKHTDHPMLKFWFYFVSSMCKRVKVGTKMVEQSVYETICEDSLNIMQAPELIASPMKELT